MKCTYIMVHVYLFWQHRTIHEYMHIDNNNWYMTVYNLICSWITYCIFISNLRIENSQTECTHFSITWNCDEGKNHYSSFDANVYRLTFPYCLNQTLFFHYHEWPRIKWFAWTTLLWRKLVKQNVKYSDEPSYKIDPLSLMHNPFAKSW